MTTDTTDASSSVLSDRFTNTNWPLFPTIQVALTKPWFVIAARIVGADVTLSRGDDGELRIGTSTSSDGRTFTTETEKRGYDLAISVAAAFAMMMSGIVVFEVYAALTTPNLLRDTAATAFLTYSWLCIMWSLGNTQVHGHRRRRSRVVEE